MADDVGTTPRGAVRALLRTLRPPTSDPLNQQGLGQGLGRRSARGAVSTLAGQWIRLVLQTASTVVLARLIAPDQYGLVAMVVSLVGVGDALWNLGLSQATVQRRDVTTEQVSFFFWFQSGLGGLLTAVVAALSPAIAGFYGQPELVPLTLVLSTMFLVNGLSAQHQAVLTRQMRFGLLSAIDVLGLFLGVVAAIVIAAMGGNAWAIAVMTLAVPVVRLVMSWWTSGWRPSRPRRAADVGPMIRFGVNLTLTNVLDYTSQNLDNVLIGRFYGAEALGLYSRAYNLLLLPLRQVTAPVARVAVPVLSYLQHQPARYRRFFMVALSAVAYASLPLICLLAALSHEVVAVMLGDQWLGAVPIFRVLSVAGVLVTLRSTNGWLFVSTGHTGRQAVWALANRPVIIVGFVVGLPWGATGVAWGFLAAHAVLLVPSFWVAVKDTPVTMANIAQSVWRPLVLAAAVYAAAFGVQRVLGGADLLVLLVGAAAAAAVLALAFLVWPAVRGDLQQMRTALRDRATGPQPEAAKGADDPTSTSARDDEATPSSAALS
ncbi:MAG TPA: lipopolysaccharide biosynthesis protein [Angustibacter sp.]|nr:lipopolysaccharide biosynthesis protein [Angustibacter sp.]